MTPAQIDHLDKSMEPKLTPEEQAELDAEIAAYEREKLDREWESWGTSPEQLAAQQQALDVLGVPEG